ncbi:MAG: NUDIX hydrolase N-terminal domain-containing protein [Gammaproteobacteria bacterium]|nr:NUDIX hydrolase N-terminal domain-containing protein [Gammaproteobacteria bacterium]MCZ6855032.1 NUDIX hydrolase N-terminal domain-containing protein [Gammaproteobacteria bacterium]
MSVSSGSEVLETIQRIRAIAQTGLTYASDDYDRERYAELRQLAVDLLAVRLEEPPERVADVYLLEQGYPTPKIDVRAGVFREGQVLLVRESSDDCWSLPGGWGDEHDSPRGCIEREVFEESGFRVRAVKLVGVKDRHLHPYTPRRLERIYKLFFLCELLGGEARGSIETTEVRFFAPNASPTLSLGRTLQADIELLEKHRNDPSLPTYFD